MSSADSPYFQQPPSLVTPPFPPNTPYLLTSANFAAYIASRQSVAETRILYDRSFERILVFNEIMKNLSQMQFLSINPNFVTNQTSIRLLAIAVDQSIASLLLTSPKP
jgi:hypothetical protein